MMHLVYKIQRSLWLLFLVSSYIAIIYMIEYTDPRKLCLILQKLHDTFKSTRTYEVHHFNFILRGALFEVLQNRI